MKKKYLLFLMCIFFLTGCEYIPINDDIQTQSVANNTISTEKIIDINSVIENSGWYYNQLSTNQKIAYSKIEQCLLNMQSQVDTSDISEPDIRKAYKSVIFDNPDIFYTDGYNLTTSINNGKYSITFTPTYNLSEEEVIEGRKKIDAYIENMISDIDINNSDYDKVLATYKKLLNSLSYSVTKDSADNVLSVTNSKEAVCSGYAKMFCLLLNKEKIEAIVIPGYIEKNGTTHMWNAININGNWYYIDPTWGDSEQISGYFNYDYFCVPYSKISQSHIFESGYEYPECTLDDMNYYVKNDLIIKNSDSAKLNSVLNELKTKKYISFMCQDIIIYQKIKEDLINDRQIHKYTGSYTDVQYTVNKETLTFTFFIN